MHSPMLSLVQMASRVPYRERTTAYCDRKADALQVAPAGPKVVFKWMDSFPFKKGVQSKRNLYASFGYVWILNNHLRSLSPSKWAAIFLFHIGI